MVTFEMIHRTAPFELDVLGIVITKERAFLCVGGPQDSRDASDIGFSTGYTVEPYPMEQCSTERMYRAPRIGPVSDC